MNCNDARRHASAYLDRDLTLGQEEDLRLHLAACPDCRAEMASLEKVRGLVSSLPETQPEAGFYAAIRGRIEELESGAEADLDAERTSLGDFIRAALSPIWLRPAAGNP